VYTDFQITSNWWTMVLLSMLRHTAIQVLRSAWTVTHSPLGLVVFQRCSLVKIYFEETDGDRWYLRVNSDNNEAVEIVSESYVNNVCN